MIFRDGTTLHLTSLRLDQISGAKPLHSNDVENNESRDSNHFHSLSRNVDATSEMTISHEREEKMSAWRNDNEKTLSPSQFVSIELRTSITIDLRYEVLAEFRKTTQSSWFGWF